MSDQEIAVSLRQVRKGYAGTPVLKGIDLDVPKGSIFALLGENGAGKSTTMRMLAGLLPADRGTVQVLGQDAFAHASELRHKVGYVPEKPRFYDWMSIAELGWFTSGFHKAGYLDKFEGWLVEFKLDPRQKLKTLSKGQYAKVGLALALSVDPEVLLLDEPTSGLDLFVRREFLASMVGLAAEGRTLIVSSHQIQEVERIASHVAFLGEGRILFAGSIDDMKRRIVALTVDAEQAPADWSKWGTLLRLVETGRSRSVVLLDPKAEAMSGVSTEALTLEGAYEALLTRKDGAA